MKKKEIRIIVLFGSHFLYGSEKANIDVFTALSEFDNVKSLFLIDRKRGVETISPYLNERNLNYKKVNYHFMFNKHMSLKEWCVKIYEILSGSFQLFYYYIKFRPTHVYTSKQEYFLNFLPFLFFVRKPIIYRIGDSPVTHNLAYSKLWSYMAKKVSKFVCVSKFIEGKVQETVKNPNNSSVIYSKPHFKLSNNFSSPKSKKMFRVLYVGQIGKHKGVDLLIEAALRLCKKYDNLFFDIAGNMVKTNEFSKNLLKKVENSGLSSRINFLGYINNVDELYERSHIHVCPSIYDEPLANVLMDAKKYSISSVIFSVGGLPEVIRNNVDGLICADKSVKDLSDAIEDCYLNPKVTKSMGVNAHESLNALGIDVFKKKWLNIFEEKRN